MLSYNSRYRRIASGRIPRRLAAARPEMLRVLSAPGLLQIGVALRVPLSLR
jgi:hypothetical protein